MTTKNTQTKICRICRESNKLKTIVASEMCIGLRTDHTYHHCLKCNSLSLHKIPNNLNQLYENYPWSDPAAIEESTTLKHLIKAYVLRKKNRLSFVLRDKLNSFNDLRIAALHPYSPDRTSNILDIGCGSGDFLSELSSFGYKNLIGIDPNLPEIIHQNKNVKFIKCKLDDFQSQQKFDIITLHHSLEHLPNPHVIFPKIKELLKPCSRSLCIVRIPNIESFSFHLFQKHWEGIHPPFHINLPSKKGIELLIQKHGLKIIEIRSEQLLESFFFSLNRMLNICDFEPLGARKFLKNLPLKNEAPPTFTKAELIFWKKKCKELKKTLLTDYISYYLKIA